MTRVIQGFETHSFKSNFESWSTATGTTGVDDGKGKVAGHYDFFNIGLRMILFWKMMTEKVVSCSV